MCQLHFCQSAYGHWVAPLDTVLPSELMLREASTQLVYFSLQHFPDTILSKLQAAAALEFSSNSNVAISQLSHTVKQWSQCLKWPKEVTLHIAYTMIMNQNNITDVDLHETVWKQAPHAMRVSFFLSHGYEIARPVHITVSSVDTAADIPDPRTGRLVFLYQPSHTLTCTCKQHTLWHC